MATVCTASSVAALKMRMAISLRFATSSFRIFRAIRPRAYAVRRGQPITHFVHAIRVLDAMAVDRRS